MKIDTKHIAASLAVVTGLGLTACDIVGEGVASNMVLDRAFESCADVYFGEIAKSPESGNPRAVLMSTAAKCMPLYADANGSGTRIQCEPLGEPVQPDFYLDYRCEAQSRSGTAVVKNLSGILPNYLSDHPGFPTPTPVPPAQN